MANNKQSLDERGSSNREVIIKEEDEEVSFFESCLLSPLDFSWESCLPFQEISHLDDPLMDMGIFGPPFQSSLDFVPSNNFLQGDYLYGFDDGLISFQNEMNRGFGNESLPCLFDENDHQQIIHIVNKEMEENGERIKKGMDNNNPHIEERNNSSSKMLLSREIISEHFNMPITQAAKKLNTGITNLKKTCRALGIERWPHRKLASIETLIKNVHELRKEEESQGADEQKLREATIEILEREKMLIKEFPDMELMENTKRLRQACFKANYKKRKTMGLKNSALQCSTITQENPEQCLNGVIDDSSGDGEEEIQSLLADYCFSSSSSNDMFLV